MRTIAGSSKKLQKPQSPGMKRLIARGRDDWFIQEQLTWLETERVKQRTDPGWFHPSSLGERCDIKLLRQYLGNPIRTPFSGKQLLIMENGNGFHDRQTKHYRKMGILEAPKVWNDGTDKIVIPDICLRGTLDWILKHPQTGRLQVIDGKSANSHAFDEAKRRGIEAHPYYVVQVLAYFVGTKIFDGGLLYENKETQEQHFVDIPWDGYGKEIWQNTVERLKNILSHAKARTIPRGCGLCQSPDECERKDIWP